MSDINGGQGGAFEGTVGQTPTERPLISNEDQTVYVDPENGDDAGDGTQADPLATIQEAVDRCPTHLRHEYIVDLTTVPSLPVTYDEDVHIQNITLTGQGYDGSGTGAPVNSPRIAGDGDTPSNVEVRSITISGCNGVSCPLIQGVRILNNGPHYSESGGITTYGGGETAVWDVEFTSNVGNGVVAYAAQCHVKRADITNTSSGVLGKRGATLLAGYLSGNTEWNVAHARIGSEVTVYENSATSNNGPFTTGQAGSRIYDDAGNQV